MPKYIEVAYLENLLIDRERYGYLDAGDIYNAPAADVAPVVHGRWIGHLLSWEEDQEYLDVKSAEYLECSVCHEKYYKYTNDFFGNLHCCRPPWDKPNLIPPRCVCGALMDLNGKD